MKPGAEGRARPLWVEAEPMHGMSVFLGPNPAAIQVQVLINPGKTSSELLCGSIDLSLLTVGTLAMQSSAS